MWRARWAERGWLIALADMPWLAPDTIRALVSMLNDGATLAAPGYDGRRGHPVGFGRAFQDELINLTGDTGARELLRSNASQLQLLPCDDAGVLMDVDTPADLSATRVWD